MRKWLILLAAAAVLAVLAGPSAALAADEELRIFIWSEYMDEENMPKAFTEKFGIPVRLDIYESNEEMVAKLQAGGVSQYDIIVPSAYIMPVLIHEKLIQPLDHAQIPNLNNLSEHFRNTAFDPGNKYSVGWQWGTVGLMYAPDKIPNFENTWAMLFNDKSEIGPFWLIDSVREQMGIALLYLGYDYNSTDPKELKAASDLLAATKKYSSCLGFKGGVGGKNDVVAGTAVAAVVYNGDAVQGILNNPDKKLAFTIPKEGSEIWIDSMCIPAKAPHVEAAHKWINWVLDPEVNAGLSNYNHYATPCEAAKPFLEKADLENPGIYPDEATMKVLHYTKDLGKDNRIMDEAWTRAKSH